MRSLNSFLDYYKKIHFYEDTNNIALHMKNSFKLFEDSLHFLDELPYDILRNVLDIGLGYGFHCEYFAKKGLHTTGILTRVTKQVCAKAEEGSYAVKEMDMHFLDYEDETFDLVWSHHSLEHSFSPLLCLKEWYRVLKKNGYLAVTVPPHKNEIVSGHFNVGWNIGQLMYLLGIAGFNIKDGYFIQEGYNVRALVTRPALPIDPKGISWIDSLKKHLPHSIQEHMTDAPASLGRFSFNGNLALVTKNKYLQRQELSETKSLFYYCKEIWMRYIG